MAGSSGKESKSSDWLAEEISSASGSQGRRKWSPSAEHQARQEAFAERMQRRNQRDGKKGQSLRGGARLNLEDEANFARKENPIILFFGWISLLCVLAGVAMFGLLIFKGSFWTPVELVTEKEEQSEGAVMLVPNREKPFDEQMVRSARRPEHIFMPGGSADVQSRLNFIVRSVGTPLEYTIPEMVTELERDAPYVSGYAYVRAMVALKVEDDLKEGRRWVEESINRGEALILARVLLAEYCYANELYEEGLVLMKACMEILPNDPLIQVGLSTFLRATGQSAEAVDVLREAYILSGRDVMVLAKLYAAMLESGNDQELRDQLVKLPDAERGTFIEFWLRTLLASIDQQHDVAAEQHDFLRRSVPSSIWKGLRQDPIWRFLANDPGAPRAFLQQ